MVIKTKQIENNATGLSKKKGEKNTRVKLTHLDNMPINCVNQYKGLKIILLGDDALHQGLISGYCQLRGCEFSPATDFVDAMLKLAEFKIRAVVITDLETLRKDKNQMFVDFLSENEIRLIVFVEEQCLMNQLENSLGHKLDFFLDKPLNLRQLDYYLRDLIEEGADFPIQLRKSHRRRSPDRRSLLPITEQPSIYNYLNKAEEGKKNCISHGIFSLDFCSKKVTKADKTMDFTPKEFQLFATFLSHPGRLFSANELIETAWPSSSCATKADLYQYIFHIRKKIEPDSKQPYWILKVKGFGYKFRDDEG